MKRRVGRYTKDETAELRRMFEEGYSVYKICRNLNRSQKSIRNNLIRLGEIEGEITPRRYVVEGKDLAIEDENRFFEYIKPLTSTSSCSKINLPSFELEIL